MISPSLQMEVTKYIFNDIIKMNPVLQESTPELIDYILQNIMNPVFSTPENFPVYDPDYLWGTTVYEKGACVLHMLRHVVGDSLFYEGLAAYRQAYEYQSATTPQFQQAMEGVYGQSLTWFFAEWVYDVGWPEYEYSWLAESQAKAYDLNLVIETATYRQNLKQALAQELDEARSIIDSTLYMIITFDLRDRISVFNQTAQWVLGYANDDVKGRHIKDLLVDPDDLKRVKSSVARNQRDTLEIEFLQQDGTTMLIPISAGMLRNPDGNPSGILMISH